MRERDDKPSCLLMIAGVLLFAFLVGGGYLAAYLARSTYEVMPLISSRNSPPAEIAVRIFATKNETYVFYAGTVIEGLLRGRPVAAVLRAE